MEPLYLSIAREMLGLTDEMETIPSDLRAILTEIDEMCQVESPYSHSGGHLVSRQVIASIIWHWQAGLS